jgi:pyruvate dehydrogenase E1 component alpha subunit/2-oxoisovalerate dehydrogenase E1 component alpha subunit
MLQTAQRQSKTKKPAPPHERFLEAFRWMLLTRTLEEKLVSLYRGGLITGGVYIGKGQEAVSAACGLFLQKGDIFAPLIRDQAGRSAFGEPLLDVTRTYLGSRQGPMRGRDGNIHRGRPRDNQLAMVSHLGAMISVNVGALMAKRFKGEKDFIGLACIGEGGMQTGAFHEGMNIAAVEQVPLVIVATNNHYAYSTPNDREFACHDLVDRRLILPGAERDHLARIVLAAQELLALAARRFDHQRRALLLPHPFRLGDFVFGNRHKDHASDHGVRLLQSG